ncbi:unnamed protein product [Rhizophagus irregularis]|nr:unnamed protein product [Rhizophagus irregularis]
MENQNHQNHIHYRNFSEKMLATFVNTDGNLFSQICKSGGNIFAYITPKQVIYHFDNSCLDINNVASLLVVHVWKEILGKFLIFFHKNML